ncbi:MGMT family protein [Kosmotoga pacifica]|uniref:Cysteine methyltransferase n=1 Tax=Kosmotoga pacifica TaxID=1330330 RepID=A0A0G2Z882_9BACT|nr:MGMT family protein [Kosmotoga pacifica]AKI97777.1 cysteine methyltransferase [Kosmotoga pacifica]
MGGKSSLYKRIYETVRRVPRGKVATYGQIANIVGCTPRMVGFALAALKADDVPWHRIVNSKGTISLKDSDWGVIQRQMLEDEGIEFNEKKIDLARFGWQGDEY